MELKAMLKFKMLSLEPMPCNQMHGAFIIPSPSLLKFKISVGLIVLQKYFVAIALNQGYQD